MENSPKTPPLQSLSFRRNLKAPCDLVFRAWTDPELMRLWLHPGPEWSNPIVEVDLRPGGHYRISFQNEDGSQPEYLNGEYLEIVHNKRLVYTWIWEEPNEFADIESVVTVDFMGTETGTEVHLVHSEFGTEAMHARHSEGWIPTLDGLVTEIDALT